MDEEKLRELLRQLKRWIKRLSINNQLVFNMENTNLKLAPKMAQVYWCEFSPPVFPELGKMRPVVVLSRQNTLHGMVTVAPITTRPQRNIEKNIGPRFKLPLKQMRTLGFFANILLQYQQED
ncbi:MAG: type II toxin-antitoxin system PemK/MazF family toxin [Rhodobacteraceae bacterium]|nr:type II toxin-antitoxin system PemK/MazF family toxin [Paracoccaceae bacterium]MYF46399.1 type II toxin-antitoxin system PemK/MazF family toxin [Paracoccaceae bacterium]